MFKEWQTMTIARKQGVYTIFFLTLLSSIVLYMIFKSISLPIARTQKMVGEIEGIKVRTYKPTVCVQYALVALIEGWYPCYNSGIPTVFLKRGEVWKYGKTCLGQDKRYPNGLPDQRLIFKIEFTGNEEQCLILEKEKIYGYYLLPENLQRATTTGTRPLIRPPGNKIDR